MNLVQISSGFIFITTITILVGEKVHSSTSNIVRLPYYVIPIHYHISLIHIYTRTYDSNGTLLNIKPINGSFTFVGISNTTINILQSIKNITLHVLLPVINSEKLILIKSNGEIYKLKEYSSEANFIDITFSDVLSPGLYTLKTEFYGNLKKNYNRNFFEYSDENEKENITWLIAPTIQEYGADQLFPCWNDPKLKTTFKISVNHHHNYTVLFNMPKRVYYNTDKNFMWTHFHVTPPMSIMQFAIVVTNFPYISINNYITLWCEKCSKQQSVKFEFAKKFIEDITLYLETEFNRKYIPKVKHIALSNFPYDGTSKWGFVFHREADLLFDEERDSFMRKIEIARLIASKIAYQWFSNIFSSTWSHFWFHDSLAVLYGEEAIVKIFNNSRIMEFFIVQSQYESLHLDSDINIDMNPVQVKRLSEIKSIFEFPRYMKVLIVLRMFQNIISNEVFRKNVHSYLRRHTFSSSISHEFSPAQEIIDWAISHNMSNEFLTWLEYKPEFNSRIPIVNWIQRTDLYGELSQNVGTKYGKWWIPIHLLEDLITRQNIKKIYLTSRNPFSNIRVKKGNLVMIDIQQAGYYRINYNSENWYEIAHYLNDKSHKYKNLNVINRAKVIDDAFHLMMTHQLNASIFWELTKYLSQVTDYIAWYPMIKVFEYMSTVFPFSENEFTYDIQGKLKILLKKPLETLGFEENSTDNDLTKCFRQEIVKWACTLQDFECIRTAHYKLKHYLLTPEKPLLPGWKQWTFCQGVAMSNNLMWLNVIEDIMLKKMPRHNLLPFLFCSGSTNTNLSFVERFIQDKERQDIAVIRSYINLFHTVIMKLANRYIELIQILTNLEYIRPKEINTLTALVDIINYVYSKEILKKISMYINNLKQLRRISDLQLLKIKTKIETRLTEINNHIDHFSL